MYGNRIGEYAEKQCAVAVERNNEITVLESLDLRIKYAKEEVARLEAVKERLSTSGLLTVRIDDLRIATNY